MRFKVDHTLAALAVALLAAALPVEARDMDTSVRKIVILHAAGGHNYDTFKHGKKRTEHGSQYETIRRWFGDHSPVVTPPLGRIRQAPQSK